MDLSSCLRETGAFFWLITNTQRAKELASHMEGSIGGCQWDTGPPHFALDPNSALVWTLGWKKMACQRFTKVNYNLPPRKKTKILQQLRCKGLCNRISNIWTSFPKKKTQKWDFHDTLLESNFRPRGSLKPKNCPNKDGHQRVPQALLRGLSTGAAWSYKSLQYFPQRTCQEDN